MNKKLINKDVLNDIIANSNICQHAIKELKLAGYGKGEGGPNDWIYQQVLEAVAVFSSHDNSGSSAVSEIELVKKLCNFDIISPLRFTDDEWCQISSDGTCQNRRKGNVFKEPDGSIHYNGAFAKCCIRRYNFATKEWTENENPNNWIMAVDANDLDLSYLSLSYDIQWKNCFCMKDIRLEDVTPELEKRAFEEIENNK